MDIQKNFKPVYSWALSLFVSVVFYQQCDNYEKIYSSENASKMSPSEDVPMALKDSMKNIEQLVITSCEKNDPGGAVDELSVSIGINFIAQIEHLIFSIERSGINIDGHIESKKCSGSITLSKDIINLVNENLNFLSVCQGTLGDSNVNSSTTEWQFSDRNRDLQVDDSINLGRRGLSEKYFCENLSYGSTKTDKLRKLLESIIFNHAKVNNLGCPKLSFSSS